MKIAPSQVILSSVVKCKPFSLSNCTLSLEIQNHVFHIEKHVLYIWGCIFKNNYWQNRMKCSVTCHFWGSQLSQNEDALYVLNNNILFWSSLVTTKKGKQKVYGCRRGCNLVLNGQLNPFNFLMLFLEDRKTVKCDWLVKRSTATHITVKINVTICISKFAIVSKGANFMM